MRSIQSIRQQARQTIQDTRGIYTLSIVPVGLLVWFNLALTAENIQSLFSSSYSNLSVSSLSSFFLFPTLLGILVSLMIKSILLSLYRLVQTQQRTTSWREAFSLFSSPYFWKVLLGTLLKSILLFLWGLVFNIGRSLLLAASIYALLALTLLDATFFFLSGIFLLISLPILAIGLAIYLPQVYAYSQMDFLLWDHLENQTFVSLFATIKESRRLMKGYKWKRLVLDLTFLGWFLLEYITFNSAMIYTLPYYHLTQIYFYKAILADRAGKEKQE